MKKSTKIIIAIIGIILLIHLLNINVTRSHLSISSTSTTNNSVNNDTLQPKAKFEKPYTVVFHGLDNPIHSTPPNGECVIEVDVTANTSLGWQQYIPFYKPIDIQSSVIYSWRNPMKTSGKDDYALEIEQFDYEGNNTIFGSVSAKHANQQTLALIHQHIQQKIIGDIKNKLGSEILE